MDDQVSLLSIYRESLDWVKAVWVLSIPAFVATMAFLAVHYRVEMKRLDVIWRERPDGKA